MKTGLFFGSFNPLHNGHLAIALFFIEQTEIEQIWFIPSPHNPLKKASELLPFSERIEMCELALAKYDKLSVCNIEASLPQPSYTIVSLNALTELYTEHDFVIILGSDSIDGFEQWKDYITILEKYKIFVYPRKKHYSLPEHFTQYQITLFHTPVFEVSSSLVRDCIKEGKDFSHMVPEIIFEFLRLK